MMSDGRDTGRQGLPPVSPERRPEVSSEVPAIALDYGVRDPLVIEAGSGATVESFRGPAGTTGVAAEAVVEAALRAATDGPPLQQHVVAADRVVVAVAGDLPQGEAVLAAIRRVLCGAGSTPVEVSFLHGPPLASDPNATTANSGDGHFDPAVEATTAYLGAASTGQSLYLARPLVDADVVLAVGAWSWNAAFGGPSIEGSLWPAFSRREARRDLITALARRGRRALPAWRLTAREVLWQLGVCASLRLVAGRQGTLHAACFGLPTAVVRRARAAAAGWRPAIAAPAQLAIASLADPGEGFAAVIRAVAAAARLTRPGATICVAGPVTRGPGLVFLRWRQGAPLRPLVREAVASGDPVLTADALQTRLFARALGTRRLVLLSDIDEATVEELGFGHAGSPEVVERLAHRAASVVVLEEADRMLPERVSGGLPR